MKRPSAIETISAGPAEDPDFRLVIEADPSSGRLIYRAIERRTKAVIWQAPRDELDLPRRPVAMR